MWAGELRKRGLPVIYFDAFANDFQADAFVALASEVVSLAKEHKIQNTPAYKKYYKHAVDTGKVLLRSSAKVGVRLATLGAVDVVDAGELAKKNVLCNCR
ncbi:MAG: hypothetical protein GC150_09955 [Rhizobiales bacterium]|nr:hypothetical protein [Hyphomicrobiales bacterium]